MRSPDYSYFKAEDEGFNYRNSRDYNTHAKNNTFVEKKYTDLSASYVPSDKYRPPKHDQSGYYSPRPKKEYIHPYDLRNSVNVLPNYEEELQRAKYRNRSRKHQDYNTARDKAQYGYKKDLDVEPKRYGKSPSPLQKSRYDLQMSSVSAHANLDYNSKKNKYLEETLPQYLSKSNVGYARSYEEKTPVREEDKKALKDKYKSYFDLEKERRDAEKQKQREKDRERERERDRERDRQREREKDRIQKRYATETTKYDSENRFYPSKSARDDYSYIGYSKDYSKDYNKDYSKDYSKDYTRDYTNNYSKDYYSTNENKYKLYDAYEGEVDKRFTKKKYEDRNSRSSQQDDTELLAKSKISRINSKSRLENSKMDDRKKYSTPELIPKEILPTFGHTVDTKASIKDFKLGKTKGEGKFGTVYMATHLATSTMYAIKKIPKEIIKSHSLENQLALEIKLQTYISHPNVLKLFGFFDDHENIYLVLEYMEEGTLFEFLKKRVNKLTEKEVSTKIREVSSAIKYLHDLDIAHRDIKPQNIVLSGGVAKLCDFGWATRCTDRRKTYCGTFDYAAPQILEGKEYDWCVDLWCLGVLTFELLTGKVPFYHISRKETMKKILRVDRDQIVFPPQISWKAKDFVQSLIKKDPHQRSRADELLGHPFLAQEKKENFLL